MALRTRDKCRAVAVALQNKQDLFVLGKGYGEPIALEGALKIKEMCYLHAEGFSGERSESKLLLFKSVYLHTAYFPINMSAYCQYFRCLYSLLII
jgi:hypothetical protein